ncbi:cytochrome c [Thioalkalivibrio sp. XN8]|uniref:c-type cytochrome n=1 Tax=Thioalkalivibrio sp. XN8 TaxID=2712863 RepID=UPI0013EA704E|nr:cytochrome c [Thioalkalivibrio sp. XN8]NGP52043.1 cytochrome c [Thioalkalivibrio sp. XN8]
MFHRKLAVIALAALAAAPALALDAEQAEKATETRQSVLEVVGWNMGPLGAMARGLVPYDAEIVARNAQRIAWMSSMIPDAFRADTRPHDVATEALPAIWENYARFEELAANTQASAERLAEVAASGDEAATKQAIGALVDDCRACHNDFRLDD